MPDWRDGLVEAFPIPEDRRPGYRKNQEGDLQHIEDAITKLSLNVPQEPFDFFGLPSELRNRIYDYVLFSKPPYRSANGQRPGSRLACLLANKKMHGEAAYILYTTYRFKVFPLQQFDSLPTIEELPPHYQALVANLEMIVGPSWTSPPRNWKVTRSLKKCLQKLPQVQTLRVFVDFDPSHPAFARYKFRSNSYIDFCGDLLGDVLEQLPRLKFVELDGNPGIDVQGAFVSRLREEAEDQDKEVKWGRYAGWAHKL